MEAFSPTSEDGVVVWFEAVESLHHRRNVSAAGSAATTSALQSALSGETSTSRKEPTTTTSVADASEPAPAQQQQQRLTTRAQRQLLHQARQHGRNPLTVQAPSEQDYLSRDSLSVLHQVPIIAVPTKLLKQDKRQSSCHSPVVAQQTLCDTNSSARGDAHKNNILRDKTRPSTSDIHARTHQVSDSVTSIPRRPSPSTHHETLAVLTGAMEEGDLFMQEAEDATKTNQRIRVDRRSRGGGQEDKRRSLPPSEFRSFTAMDDRRPRTSGGGARPASRLGLLQSQHDRIVPLNELREGTITAFDDINRQRRGSRYSAAAERQPTSPRAERVRSPELTRYGRLRQTPADSTAPLRRTSTLVQRLQDEEGDSPADSSEPKQSQPESTSAESQTAPSTVWDELDDLKSRIKKLELTGKLPTTSGAAVNTSSPQMERPRTATTAPTTIDSSPKRDQKAGEEQTSEESQSPAAYPLLHAALAKAKPLLNPALYRSLEATASDALQLAAMAGGSPSGTQDRQMRRKADNMCRNLTDLCLALCDGKHETSITASPVAIDTNLSMRYSRAPSRVDTERASRPLSRLEARRSSIFGAGSLHSPGTSVSPRRNADELSASEVDTPSQYTERRRYARSSSRVSLPRTSRLDEVSGDEDPTVRPPSRNGSEFSFRSKQPTNTRDYHTPQRSVSLREALGNRRSVLGSGGHRELARVASMSSDSGRRLWTRDSTPPVLEEEISEQDQPIPEVPLPRQRLSSFGHLRPGPVRSLKETPCAAAAYRDADLKSWSNRIR